jgi:ribosome-associated translation inhibitor RaiA
MSNYRSLVEDSIQKCESSAADLRTAASQAHNTQARNAFEQAAQELEKTVQKCRTALNQLY